MTVTEWPTKTYPLPWTYHPSQGDTDRDYIEAANGNIVVDCVGAIDGPAICRACNCHSDLLEACLMAASILEDHDLAHVWLNHPEKPEQTPITQLTFAIAKATGGCNREDC